MTHDQPGDGWAAVLRRHPARIADGRPEGGDTGAFEVTCRYRGNDPRLKYGDVSPGLPQLRGRYPIVGLAADEAHSCVHPQAEAACRPGREPMLADRR